MKLGELFERGNCTIDERRKLIIHLATFRLSKTLELLAMIKNETDIRRHRKQGEKQLKEHSGLP